MEVKRLQIKCLSWGSISKVTMGNPNAGFTEGNIQTAKKIVAPDGSAFNYVSGQCQRHGLRERFAEIGEALSTPVDGEVETTLGDPLNYIDDDLFGYMIAVTGDNRKRTSPVRIAPLVSLFPYRGDRDLLTKTRKASDKGGNMVETEVYSAYLRGGGLIELDRVGKFDPSEIKETTLEIQKEERLRRLNLFLDSMMTLWTGGKQTNILSDISPKFIAFAFQTVKLPFLLESVSCDTKGKIMAETLIDSITNYSSIIDRVIIGTTKVLDASALDAGVPETVEVLPMTDAFSRVKEILSTI